MQDHSQLDYQGEFWTRIGREWKRVRFPRKSFDKKTYIVTTDAGIDIYRSPRQLRSKKPEKKVSP